MIHIHEQRDTHNVYACMHSEKTAKNFHFVLASLPAFFKYSYVSHRGGKGHVESVAPECRIKTLVIYTYEWVMSHVRMDHVTETEKKTLVTYNAGD